MALRLSCSAKENVIRPTLEEFMPLKSRERDQASEISSDGERESYCETKKSLPPPPPPPQQPAWMASWNRTPSQSTEVVTEVLTMSLAVRTVDSDARNCLQIIVARCNKIERSTHSTVDFVDFTDGEGPGALRARAKLGDELAAAATRRSRRIRALPAAGAAAAPQQ